MSRVETVTLHDQGRSVSSYITTFVPDRGLITINTKPYLLMVLSIALYAALAVSAEALPAFAKKYSAPCTLCHSSWPKLNRVGWQFKVNGYQLPDSRDGSKVGKQSPSIDLNLDIGNANPPLSFRFGGGIDLYAPKTTPDGSDRAKSFACCSQANSLKLYLAGTVASDLGYFVSFPIGSQEAEQAYIRFANMFGNGTMGVDIGAFRTTDFDVAASGREWFGEPNPALYGNESFTAGDQGMSAGHVDTGIRLFGNPGYGPFSYDIVYVTGARASGSPGRSTGRGVGVMGRVDADHFSGSLRYWDSESGEITFKKDAGGFFSHTLDENSAGTGIFPADPLNPDESTRDLVLSLKYEKVIWQVEAVYDMNVFKVDDRTDAIGNTYSQDSVTRNGFSIAGIIRVSSKLAIGARYGISMTGSYNYRDNGTPVEAESAKASSVELKFEFTPVQNAKISFQYTLDESDIAARKDETGSAYDLQSKFVLLWDWAI